MGDSNRCQADTDRPVMNDCNGSRAIVQPPAVAYY